MHVGDGAMRKVMTSAIAMGCAVTLCVLPGCGTSSADFARQLNQKIGEAQGSCVPAYVAAATSFPLNIDGYGSINGSILEGLQRDGYINLQEKPVTETSVLPVNRYSYVISLTDKGKTAHVWDAQHGFCVGHKVVKEVVEWTKPTAFRALTFTQVTYTWRLDGSPSWTDSPSFDYVPGLRRSETGYAVFVQTNRGWSFYRFGKI